VTIIAYFKGTVTHSAIIEFPWRIMAGTLMTAGVALYFSNQRS
jgi:hypothetical protein